jgi:hypothetical protein
MKSALSLVLIVCLVASAVPVAAQAVPTGGRRGASDWSRVRNLAPGLEITVAVHGLPIGLRHFLRADESQLTVLNLTDPALAFGARRALADVAAHHPAELAAADPRATFESGNVRIGPGGVAVAGQRIGDLGQFVERIPRGDVIEIVGPAPEGLHGGKKGALIGAGVGAGWLIAGLAAGSGCSGNDVPCAGIAVVGIAFFAGIGALIGTLADHSRRPEKEVIYRAP